MKDAILEMGIPRSKGFMSSRNESNDITDTKRSQIVNC